MKTLIQKSALLSVLFFLAGAFSLYAQPTGMTSTVMIQPCNNNGKIGVTVSGLTPPINYTYTNWTANIVVVHNAVPTVTDDLSGISSYQTPWGNANQWNIVASDGANSASGFTVLNAPFTDSTKVLQANCPANSSLQAVGFAGGTAPYSCLWTNLTTSVSYAGNPAGVPNGQYAFVITDAAGCQVTSTFSSNLYVNSISTITANVSGSPANCANGTATITPSGGTGPYTYLWSNNATSQSLSGLSAGQMSCIITDAIGCTRQIYYYVQQAVTINYNKTITNATCIQNNGAVTSFVNGGTPPYSYLWSNAATTADLTGVPGGNYIVQITDANGCTGTGYAYVGVSTPIIVTTTTQPSSCTAATGAATISATGGQSPYSYLWYTFPSNTTGVNISGKTQGNYGFKVTDANGCIQTGAASIPFQSTLFGGIGTSAVMCPQTTGNVFINVNGSNPPFTYLWNTSATSTSLSGVPLGSYNCTVTDAVGCQIVKYGSLYANSPVNTGVVTSPVNCQYATNGAATVVATGGVGPYTYQWSNAQTTNIITGLPVGGVGVTATDANGCTDYAYGWITNAATSNTCYCTITGTVYTDANSNCTRNTGENGIPNIQIHCAPFGYAYTNSNGVYSFQVPSGNYTVSESVQQIYPLASCQANSQTVSVTAGSGCLNTINFANNVVLLHDLHIITANLNWPIPGNVYQQRVIVQNDGTMIESTGQVGYKHDGQLTFGSSSPWTFSQQNATAFPNWYSISSGFPTLNPGASANTQINYSVATNVPLNTSVVFGDSIAKSAPIATQWLNDNTPWNNVDYHTAYVVGSYDPNFKEVSPQGTGPQGNITQTDTLLTYIVHFQNTGSYFAQNITVIDTLDPSINPASVHPGYSDHVYRTTMSENGVMSFTFKNINLPWQSQYGDALSSGMFTYSVRLKKNLPLGTQIRNRAAIYFDFNEPIITNTTLNTITKVTGIAEIRQSAVDNSILFPNPANSSFTLRVQSKESTEGLLKIYDVSGREVSVKVVQLEAGENDLFESTAHLENGIYFVQLKAGNVLAEKKLLVTH